MENLDQIVKAINTVGFPIAAFAAMFWYMVIESREMRRVVDNNTNTLSRLLEHVAKDGE